MTSSVALSPTMARGGKPATQARTAPRSYTLVALTAVLLGLGVVLVYSASSVFAAKTYDDAEFFLKRQLVFAAVGSAAAWWFGRIRGEALQRRASLVFFGSVFLCAIVLVPGIGKLVGGARR